LTDPKHQESFFHDIQDRYLSYCGAFPSVPALDEQFNSLSMKANNAYDASSLSSGSTTEVDISTLQNILMDMRKLREGLLASARLDDFAKQAYLFITRASILMSHPESYFPSLRHLLYTLNKRNPLSKPEINELASYLMLHLACSTNSYHDAYEVKLRFKVRDHRVDTVIRALVSGDYWLFWTMKRVVDGYKSKIMDMAAKDIRKHSLKCIGASYQNVDLGFLEEMTGRKWQVLQEEFGVGWERDGEKIVVRRRPGGEAKPKTSDGSRETVAKIPKESAKMEEILSKPKVQNERSTGLGASRWSTNNQEKSGSDNWTKWG
jgi:hypothetical protein